MWVDMGEGIDSDISVTIGGINNILSFCHIAGGFGKSSSFGGLAKVCYSVTVLVNLNQSVVVPWCNPLIL